MAVRNRSCSQKWISLHSSAPSPSPLPCNHQPLSLCFNLILIMGDKDNTVSIEIGKGWFSSIVTQIEPAATWFPSDDGDTSTSCRSPPNSTPSSASLAVSESRIQIRRIVGVRLGKVRKRRLLITGVRLPYGSKKKVGDYRGGGRGGFIFWPHISYDGLDSLIPRIRM